MEPKDKAEIAKELTKAMIEKGSFVITGANYQLSATAIADIYKTIYKAVENPN